MASDVPQFSTIYDTALANFTASLANDGKLFRLYTKFKTSISSALYS